MVLKYLFRTHCVSTPQLLLFPSKTNIKLFQSLKIKSNLTGKQVLYLPHLFLNHKSKPTKQRHNNLNKKTLIFANHIEEDI